MIDRSEILGVATDLSLTPEGVETAILAPGYPPGNEQAA